MGYNRNTAYARHMTTNNPLSNKMHKPLLASRIIYSERIGRFPHAEISYLQMLTQGL
jgi:hypothetical protein